MKLKEFILGLTMLCVFMMIGPIKVNANTVEKKEILFISSYNPSFATFNDQVNGLKEGIEQDVQIQIEYMDLRAFSSEENEENFYNLLKYKLTAYNEFSAVILGDDEALEFGVKYRNELFKDIPIVFLGAANKELIDKALELDNISGVNEIESVHENIEFIRKFHRNVDNIIFLDRYDEKWRTNQFLEECRIKYKDLTFEAINTRTMQPEEIKDIAKGFDEKDAILMFYPVNFKDGRLMTYEKINKIIYQTSKVPIYNTISYGVGDGGIGGKVISHFEQGKEAGKIAKDILFGNNLDNKYIDGEEVNKYIFDYNRLKEFNIDEKDLPKEAVILNKPISFLQQYKVVIIPGVISLIGLFTIIIALIIFIINRTKYAKELLKAKQLAEEISKSKGHFISNISHELRTPVTVIMSAMQLIKLKIGDDKFYEENGINNNLSIINQNCYRLLRLINNIIDTAKIESGFMEFKAININAVELVESITQSVIPHAKTKDLEVIFDTTEEEIYMAVDPNKIDRIILNLLSNAIKFSKKGGSIEVTTDKIDDIFKISVKDSGIGIEQKKIEKIFEKFVRVDESFMRVNEGSGIGLSIVKSFVELHKGKIYVTSNLGEGSEFIIEIPIKLLDEKNDEVFEEEDDEVIIKTKVEFSDIYF